MGKEMLTVATAGSALIQACEKAGVVIPRCVNLAAMYTVSC
jgi:hypothetical protein